MKKLVLVLVTLVALLSNTAQAGKFATYFHNDHLGSPVMATNDQGRILWQKSYSAFGEENVGSSYASEARDFEEKAYLGKIYDEDTELLYVHARYYDPKLARFISPDPVTPLEGGAEHFHRYSYGLNSPYMFADIDGMDTVVPFNERTPTEQDPNDAWPWRRDTRYDLLVFDFDDPIEFNRAINDAGFGSMDDLIAAYDNGEDPLGVYRIGMMYSYTFEANQLGSRGSILGPIDSWKYLIDMASAGLVSGKGHEIAIVDPYEYAIQNQILYDGHGRQRAYIHAHAGGSGASAGCVTKVTLVNDRSNHAIVGNEFRTEVPSLNDPNEKSYIYLPSVP